MPREVPQRETNAPAAADAPTASRTGSVPVAEGGAGRTEDRGGWFFRLTLGVYYLLIGTWFGATVMMGVSAGLTFATTRAAQPVLPTGPTSLPDLAAQSADYLAGDIVSKAFTGLTILQLVCIGVGGIIVVIQCSFFRRRLRGGMRGPGNVIRLALLILAVGLFAADMEINRPAMWRLHHAMYDTQTTAHARAIARVNFDDYHTTSTRLQVSAALLMAAAALASPFALQPAGAAAGVSAGVSAGVASGEPAKPARSTKPPGNATNPE